MTFAATVLLAVALGIFAYKTGIKRGTDVAQTMPMTPKDSEGSLEAQASDAGYERAQMEAKLAENTKVIGDLKRQLSEQTKVVNSLKTAGAAPTNSSESAQPVVQQASDDRRQAR